MTSPPAGAYAPAHGGPPKRRLRNYLLDPRFQLKYAGIIVAVAVVLMVGLGLVIRRATDVASEQARQALRESEVSSRLVRMNQLADAADNPELVRTIERELRQADQRAAENLARVDRNRRNILYALVGSGLLLVLLLGIVGIVITHKVVGPVFKLKRLLRQVGRGELDVKERLRRGDELEDLFEVFLAMADSLKNAQAAELATLDEALKEAESGPLSPATLAKLRDLRATMRRSVGLAEGGG